MTAGFPGGTNARANELGRGLTPTGFATLLGVLVVMVFPTVVAGTQTFFFRDYGLFSYPLACYHRENFWRKEIPLWNPLNDCGIPFLAQWNTLVCYPLSALYLFLPLPWSLGIFCLFHLWLAGVGMYALALRWTTNRFSASVAGVIFAFNGLTLNCLIWPSTIATLAWMPWVIRSAELAVKSGGRRLFSSAVLGVLQMLSGGPEVILFTWVLVVAVCSARPWSDQRVLVGSLTRLLLLIALIVALCAVQLLPFLDLLRHCQRSSAEASAESSMPAWGWANLLVPLFHCYRTSAGVYLQAGQRWASSYYVGIGAVALALWAILGLKDRRVRLLAGVAGAALVLALGDSTPLYSALRRALPVVGVMNFPVKFVIPVAFVVPLLAAMALRGFFSREQGTVGASAVRRWMGIGLFLLALIGIVLAVSYWFPKEEGEWAAVWWNGVVRMLVLVLTLYLVPAIRRQPAPGRRELLGASLLLLCWLDLRFHAPWQNPTVSPGVYATELQSARKWLVAPKPGESRVMNSLDAIRKFNMTLLADPVASCVGTRLGLSHNCNLLEHIPKVDGFFPLRLREENEVRRRLYLTTNSILERVADYLGVCQITAPGTFFDWKPRSTFLPLITSGQTPVFAEDAAILAALMEEHFEPRQVIYLPVEARRLVAAAKATDSVVSGKNFSSRVVQFSVESPSATVVSVAQSYYHWWKAYVDGQPVPLLRANYAFQAVPVPAGRHEVKLVYDDPLFLAGAILSIAAAGGCAGGMYFANNRQVENFIPRRHDLRPIDG